MTILKKDQIPWNKGLKGVQKGYWTGKKRLSMTGDKHPNWKGGKVFPNCRVCGKQLSRKSAKTCILHRSARGENAYQWKGDKVGYAALHDWVYKVKGRPIKCEHCGKTKKRFYWANKSQKYKRDIDDWLSLCASCHRKYDLKFKPFTYKSEEARLRAIERGRLRGLSNKGRKYPNGYAKSKV